jgi:hypothetical protein
MREDELAALRADLPLEPELASPAADPLERPSGEAEPPGSEVPVKADPAILLQAIAPLVRVVGAVVTTRAHVSALEEAEVGHLSQALVALAATYDFTMSPRSAAWLGVGLVTAVIIEKRRTEWKMRKPATKPEPNPPPAPPVDPGGFDPGLLTPQAQPG